MFSLVFCVITHHYPTSTATPRPSCPQVTRLAQNAQAKAYHIHTSTLAQASSLSHHFVQPVSLPSATYTAAHLSPENNCPASLEQTATSFTTNIWGCGGELFIGFQSPPSTFDCTWSEPLNFAPLKWWTRLNLNLSLCAELSEANCRAELSAPNCPTPNCPGTS